MVAKLFQKSLLGGLALANRFVRSATWEGMAEEDGSCSPGLVEVIGELARGEVGLIISSHAFVSPEGQAGPRQLAVYHDRFIRGLGEMARVAHGGKSRIVLQLAHAGVQADSSLTKLPAVGPSSRPVDDDEIGRAMTPKEIGRTVKAFETAAERARAAGFDGVQIHAAHGYLLSQFLSPYFNRRSDEFGGTNENRARLVLLILERIKATCGREFPVLIKLNSEDFIEGGLTVGAMIEIAGMLEAAGIDGIEMSGGSMDAASRFKPVRRGRLSSEEQEGYYREAARRFKKKIGVPLILVGGIRSYTVAEKLVEEGTADYIALSRPLIREPRLIARWKSGNMEKSPCRSCNLCFKPIRENEGMYCAAERRKRETETSG